MGALCSCFHVPDEHDDPASHNSSSDDCMCPNCCIQRFLNKHVNLFGRRATGVTTSDSQQEATSVMVVNHSSDQSSSFSVPQPSNAGPMGNPEQQDLVMERQEKSTNLSRVEEEPNRQTFAQANDQLLDTDKIPNPNNGFESLDHNTKSIKILSFGEESGIAHTCPSADDEDVCPTCLEEYTEENPKILTKCSHNYHLGCIYEWMERSATCPVCGRLMEFDE